MTTTTGVDPYAFINGNKTAEQPQKNDELGQNAFLKLMLAQLKNQDPMKPQDPSEFLGQLAQFSQVTSTQNMEKSIEGLSQSLRSTQVLNGTSLVGREILSPADTDTIAAGGTVSGAVEVPDGADITKLQVVVKDDTGATVRTFDIKDPKEGLNNFTWDGKDNTGTAVPAGKYTFEVLAAAGQATGSLDPMLVSKVNSVTIDPSTSSLTLNTSTGAVALTDVRRVL
jgi:flagellar basal-body rod modification protein FlgD